MRRKQLLDDFKETRRYYVTVPYWDFPWYC
jgi:hypothetical protein